MKRLAATLVAVAVVAATASIAAGAQSSSTVKFFRTAGTGAYCVIFADPQAPPPFLQCAVKVKLPRPTPRPRGCPFDSGFGFTLYRRGPAQGICASNSPASGGPFRVLRVGQRFEFSNFHCLATPVGVRCVNPVGRGFVLGAAGWRRL